MRFFPFTLHDYPMQEPLLSVREIRMDDIPLLSRYWLEASDEQLLAMGADPAKMPDKAYWQQALATQIRQPYSEKAAYAIIWEENGQPIGHCNINQIRFGEEAHMHLHLWQAANRRQGLGLELVKKTLPFFFRNFQLNLLICEPYALNPAPNKTLEKAGFRFVQRYRCIPGSINFEQEVNRWEMSAEAFHQRSQ